MKKKPASLSALNLQQSEDRPDDKRPTAVNPYNESTWAVRRFEHHKYGGHISTLGAAIRGACVIVELLQLDDELAQQHNPDAADPDAPPFKPVIREGLMSALEVCLAETEHAYDVLVERHFELGAEDAA